jgi:acetyl-CoA carboxylase biotin carboxylase subunit
MPAHGRTPVVCVAWPRCRARGTAPVRANAATRVFCVATVVPRRGRIRSQRRGLCPLRGRSSTAPAAIRDACYNSTHMFRKVLIANRGEIAVRIIRALHEMDIAAVAVYSDADRTSLHVRMADEAEHIGPPPSSESYLRIDRIIEAARKHGAEAVHPGYGFLSENADFAAACEAARLTFIGPPAGAIRKMGSKTAARQTAIAAGTRVVPGTDHAVTAAEAAAFANQHGYPILLKAVAGGGGKGMRRVDREPDLESAFRTAASEAERAFRNPQMYVERLIEQPRHIEIQVFGDRHGNLVHLGERECSIQRRHQKVMEECPSPLVAAHPEMRHAMGEAAVRAACAAGYYNAGTVEFLVDSDRRFYFLEMNTRLQVEHPITELVTGLDLVKLQIEIAAGKPLPFAQQDVSWNGSAIECRIYAEDPYNNFLPYPGTLTRLSRPLGPGIRLDGCVYTGWTVPVDYDPLLAKLAVRAGSRDEAISRMIRALREYDVGGIRTNIGLFRQILEDPEFRAGRLHTGFIEEFFARSRPPVPPKELAAVAALVAALDSAARTENGRDGGRLRTGSAWLSARRSELMQ